MEPQLAHWIFTMEVCDMRMITWQWPVGLHMPVICLCDDVRLVAGDGGAHH
jgi:hypothetical protein